MIKNSIIRIFSLLPIVALCAAVSAFGQWLPNGTGIFFDGGDVVIGSSTASARLHVTGGAVLFEGTTGVTPVSGGGTRFMWIPEKAALRAGMVATTNWDDVNVGSRSIALGNNPIASGIEAVAISGEATASGDAAIAIGRGTRATNNDAVAIGAGSLATGQHSTAIQEGRATGEAALAIGIGATATGVNSAAIGGFAAVAEGRAATATGQLTSARGDISFVSGERTQALNLVTTAMGFQSVANADYATAIGYIAAASGFGAVSFGGSSSGRQSTSFGGGTAATGDFSIAGGQSSVANGEGAVALGYANGAGGEGAFAGGFGTSANGDHATSFGFLTGASGDNATALGLGTFANGETSFIVGSNATADGDLAGGIGSFVNAKGGHSFALGQYLTTDGDSKHTIVIGKGCDNLNHLVNKIDNSLMVGFNSTVPTLFVGPGDCKTNHTGNVGVGLDDPLEKVHVRGDKDEIAAVLISPNAEKNGDSEVQLSEDAKFDSGMRITFDGDLEQLLISGKDGATAYGPHIFVNKVDGFTGIGDAAPAYRVELPNTASVAGRGRANAWTIYSSERWKENITTFDDALSAVQQLRGVRFAWKREHGARRDIGFIAEEIGRVLPEVVDWEDDGRYAKSVNYTAVIPVLVEAIKEQQALIENSASDNAGLREEIQRRNSENTTLRQEVDQLSERLARLEEWLAVSQERTSGDERPSVTPEGANGAFLQQNEPNPFDGLTSIEYALPAAAGTAELVIANATTGAVVQRIALREASGTVALDASAMPSGAYVYSLVAGGTALASKKLIVAK